MNAQSPAWESAPALRIPTTTKVVAARSGTTSCSMYGSKVTVFFTFASPQKKWKLAAIPAEGQ
jgi:hypothetical protein